MRYKCYDTCSLLEQAGHLFTSDEYTLIITSITFEELEDVKKDSMIYKSQSNSKLERAEKLVEKYKTVAKTAVDK